MVMSAVPKLEWGTNRHTLESEKFLSSHNVRAARAGVHPDTQKFADTIYDHGDHALIERVRGGVVTVSDAYRSIIEDDED